jgi:hypothetical protein
MSKHEPSKLKPGEYLVLPDAIRAIAPLAEQDPDGSVKFNDIYGVRFTLNEDGSFSVRSTNGKYGAVVTGKIGIAEPNRFPPLEEVLPTSPPLAWVKVDGKKLAKLLWAAQKVAGSWSYVTLELREPDKVICVRSKAPESSVSPGETVPSFVGVLMPINLKAEDVP